MDIADLKKQGSIVLECVSGSRAYGLATPESDTDIKGVFILPKTLYYSLDYVAQVSDETNDIVYYELKRLMGLLAKNNPNMLELLNTPDDCVRYRHPVMQPICATDFVSKLCKNAFAGYAMTQIRKAKGLNKKMVNPMNKTKKNVLDFCYVVYQQGSISVTDFLRMNGLQPMHCGLAKIPHMHDAYHLYYSTTEPYKGIVPKETANDISLSSIAKGAKSIAIMSFNKSGYSKYCKEYKDYWDWVQQRNQVRYHLTVEHGKNYDAKNMMHTFRLLAMAEEIGKNGTINVRRMDREYLLKIKRGEFQYDELVNRAEQKIKAIDILYLNANLPDQPDLKKINAMLVSIREAYYETRG